MANIIEIIRDPKISAVYYGLLMSGYEFYADGKEIAVSDYLKQLFAPGVDFGTAFFAQSRQNTCEVYPFWPRASLMERACYFTDVRSKRFADFDTYINQVMSAENLLEVERAPDFWDWIAGFPEVLSNILVSAPYKSYAEWEGAWIERQRAVNQALLEPCAHMISRLYESGWLPLCHVFAVLCPIKCALSADYHTVNDSLYVTSGLFDISALQHELLHTAIHPFVCEHRTEILTRDISCPGVDPTYFLSSDERGKLNAFEEYAVRHLTALAIGNQPYKVLEKALTGLLPEKNR